MDNSLDPQQHDIQVDLLASNLVKDILCDIQKGQTHCEVTTTTLSSPLSSHAEHELESTKSHLGGHSSLNNSSSASSASSDGEEEELNKKANKKKEWERLQIEQYKKLQSAANSASVKSSQNSSNSSTSTSRKIIGVGSIRGGMISTLTTDKKSRVNSTHESGASTPINQGSVDISGNDGVLLPGRKKYPSSNHRNVPTSQLNARDRSGRTLIFKYAKNGDWSTTQALLKGGASLRIADHAGWTPLHEACLAGQEQIVELLLAFDADVDARGGDGDTPLHDAVGNGHVEVVHILLRHGANLSLVNENGQTAEEFAIETLNQESVDVPGSKKDSIGDQKDAIKILELLRDWKKMTEQVVKRNQDGQTLFHLACSEGDVRQVFALLEYGADINATDNSGWTPIHNAAISGHEKVMRCLLQYGSEVDPLGFDEETPLHDAVSNGHVHCAEILLRYGAEPFRKNGQGKMAVDLIPEGFKELQILLNHPLEYWQPVKTPDFYPRLLGEQIPREPKSATIAHSYDTKEVSTPQQNSSFAWGGLQPVKKGAFESSREEKKFQAMMKSFSNESTELPAEKSENVEKSNNQNSNNEPFSSSGSKPRGRPTTLEKPKREPSITEHIHSKSIRADTKIDKAVAAEVNNFAPKRPSNGIESEPKRQSLGKESKQPRLGRYYFVLFSETKTRIPLPDFRKKDPKSAFPKPVARPPVKIVEKAPAALSKLHLALAETRDDDHVLLKKKKRFTFSGYQAVGESNEKIPVADPVTPIVNSELSNSLILKPMDLLNTPNIYPIPPPKIAQESLVLIHSANEARIAIEKAAKKTSAEIKYCLPLCAYVKSEALKSYFRPVNTSRENLWGSLPKEGHTKAFVDLQLANCLGLQSGRQLLEKYPKLDARVATTLEKSALEATILSNRILTTMLLTMDPSWIQSTTIDGLESLKLVEVDIYIVSWNQELFRILNLHVGEVEKELCIQLDWIQDLTWPAPIEEPKEIAPPPKVYVHKLKRFKTS